MQSSVSPSMNKGGYMVNILSALQDFIYVLVGHPTKMAWEKYCTQLQHTTFPDSSKYSMQCITVNQYIQYAATIRVTMSSQSCYGAEQEEYTIKWWKTQKVYFKTFGISTIFIAKYFLNTLRKFLETCVLKVQFMSVRQEYIISSACIMDACEQ